jgi:SAM-dependent methyltransferase
VRQDGVVTTDNAAAWDRLAAAYQQSAKLPTSVVHYGPDVPNEDELRLLGDVRGKRVLELGCGAAQASIALVKAGATAVGVDASAEQLAHARRLCAAEEVRVELRHGDLADLAFLRADSIDLAFSANSFQYVEDLGRVFRQVHRVLKVGAPLVFSLPHPAASLIDESSEEPLTIRRSYFDRGPRERTVAGVGLTTYPHAFGDLCTGLVRASYRIELVLEPEPVTGVPRSWEWREVFSLVPRTLIVRARKEGN